MKAGRTGGSSRGPSKSSDIVSMNPATGKVLGRVPSVGRRGIKKAVTRAAAAFQRWSHMPVRERQDLLWRLAGVIRTHKHQIAELIAKEQGKPMTEAMGTEVLPVLGILKDLSRNAHKVLRPVPSRHQQILFAHKRSHYSHVPFGVVAVISPWNYPFSVPLPQIAAALVAGNTVLFKPARSAVLVGRKIDDLFEEAGFPVGVLNTVVVKEKDAPVITQHPDVKKIVFTGSTAVGRKIMAAAAEGIKPVVLELGGNDPVVVAADADVRRAARGVVWGAMFSSGQACVSVERAYVERPIAEPFIQACVEEAARIRVGDPLLENTDMGPLTNRAQLNTVMAHVGDAVAKGARIRIGGKKVGKRGYFYAPTVLSSVNHSMAVMREETFGPVLPVMVVDSLDEAIELANDSVYGLSAYGWTGRPAVAERLMNELEAGNVLINDCSCTWGEPNAPWGGVKWSGIGRTRAVFGLREMVQVKYASFDEGGRRDNAWWYPYNQETRRLFSDAADLLVTNSVFRKVSPLLALLRNRRFAKTARWAAIFRHGDRLF